MTGLFLDTSALLALLDADEDHHGRVAVAWREILAGEFELVTSNYVLVETCALMQHRLGLEAVQVFHDDIAPLLAVQWVTPAIHAAAVSGMLAAGRRRLSLVDCASFAVMRAAGLTKAFTLDRHFREQGFTCVPSI